MKLVSLKIVIVAVCCLCAFLMTVDAASAHRVNVFAWVEADTVYVESKFPSGKKVKAGKVLVMDSQGNELLSGLTNDEGEFAFKVPKRTDLRIVLIAGQGHQAEWTIRASEMADLTSKTAPGTGDKKAIPSERTQSVSKPSAETSTTAPQFTDKSKELEAVIETVLDRKLKPITRMLADLRQEGPTVRDIFAGIGYILGLVGIAAYVQSRKKKE
jgi:nickel transport protein